VNTQNKKYQARNSVCGSTGGVICGGACGPHGAWRGAGTLWGGFWSLGLDATRALTRSSAVFWVVCFMLVLSLYFLTLVYSTESGLEQSYDHFFCSHAWRENWWEELWWME